MIEKIYFYRKIGTADFILSEKEKKIIPVRIKNQFLPDNLVYNWSNNIWEKADSIPEENRPQRERAGCDNGKRRHGIYGPCQKERCA